MIIRKPEEISRSSKQQACQHGNQDDAGDYFAFAGRRDDDGDEHAVQGNAQRAEDAGRKQVSGHHTDEGAAHPSQRGNPGQPIGIKGTQRAFQYK